MNNIYTMDDICKILNFLIENNWDLTDSKAEKLLSTKYFDIYLKQKGTIFTGFNELKSIKQKLDKLQDNNNHSGYMLEVARFCNNEKYIKIFEHISYLHELDGFLVCYLNDYRNLQWENMKELYAEKLKPLGIFPLNIDVNSELPF